jgi:hypothetical protein
VHGIREGAINTSGVVIVRHCYISVFWAGFVIIINGIHTCPSQCMKKEMLVLWNQAIHTDREVTANRPDIIIKN